MMQQCTLLCWLPHTALLIALLGSATALLCFESQEDPFNQIASQPPRAELRNCTDCDYCVFSVNAASPTPDVPSLFGTGPVIEDTYIYKPIFAQSTPAEAKAANPFEPAYNVLSLCILEKYEIGGMISYGFRCFCETDGCNKASDIEDYVARTRLRDTLNTLASKTNSLIDDKQQL